MANPPDNKPQKLTTEELLNLIAKLPTEAQPRAARGFLAKWQPSSILNRTPEAVELESAGWEPWLSELAPHVFKGTHAEFHRKFWDWFWKLLLAKRDGVRLAGLDVALAYLLTLGRGMGKSTTVEWSTIALGAILGNVLGLYISSTAKLAKGHLTNIREEIEDTRITKYYPGLSNPEVGKFNNRYGWNQDLLATSSGLTIFALGLEEEVRGIKKRQLRPALIVLDEFDAKTDSPDVVRKKESIIGGSVFGTQVEDSIIVMAQNLIHGQSVATRTLKRRNQLLSFREESGVIPAFSDDLELQMVGTRWNIMKGRPVWDYFDRATFQKFLDTSGPIETYAEYQHVFDQDRSGKVLPNYVDLISVITEEDFASIYGVRRPPASWNKYVFNDKARTKTEWHANVGGTLTMSNQNSPLPGITFLYDCLTFEEGSEPDDCALSFLRSISPRALVDGVEYDWEELVRAIITREGLDRFTGSMKEQMTAQREGLARVIPKYVRPLLTRQHYLRFRMSHEADDWRKIYREVFGLPFEAANPSDGEGVGLINLSMKVDYSVRDPFKRMTIDANGLPLPLMGMSRFYIIVKSNKLAYPNDNKPDELYGSDLARYQFTEHKYLSPKLNALGEEERGQEKRNDDYVNGLQFFYMDHSIQARALTPQEAAELQLDPSLTLAAIDAESDPEKKEKAVYQRDIALRREQYAKIAHQLAPSTRAGASTNRLLDWKQITKRGS